MAITREKKQEFLAKYKEDMERSEAVFVTQYQGLTVNQMTSLRKKLKEVNTGYTIVKKTLVKRMLDEAGIKYAEEIFEGPVGMAFSFGDSPPVAKALLDIAKEEELFNVKGGFIGSLAIDEKGIEDLSKLPAQEVVQAQLLGLIGSPSVRLVSLFSNSTPSAELVNILAASVRQVVNVLNAHVEQGEGSQ